MGALIELLTSEMFRKRTSMYTGSSDFKRISSWLRGFEYAQSLLGGSDDIEGFKEWLQIKFKGPGNTDWLGIIENRFRGDDDAIRQKLFDELDLFLEYRYEVGINQIIDEHEAYEIKRYGQISSSRLKRR